jgi:hypothetical protein
MVQVDDEVLVNNIVGSTIVVDAFGSRFCLPQ